MGNPKIIAVCGVTGIQGNSVADTFSRLPGWEVRGLTRSVDSSAAQKLAKDLGVEIVQAELNEPSMLLEAFRGADAIFANTDFFSLMKSPNLSEVLSSQYPGMPVNEACMAREIEQGKDIVDAAADILAGKARRCSISSTARSRTPQNYPAAKCSIWRTSTPKPSLRSTSESNDLSWRRTRAFYRSDTTCPIHSMRCCAPDQRTMECMSFTGRISGQRRS